MPKDIGKPAKTAKKLAARARGATSTDTVLDQLESRANAVTIEVGGSAIALTHLDRIYWPSDARFDQPAITKRDLIRYLVQVSPMMLPHIADRPLTLFRWPGGIQAKRMLVKHWEGELPPFIERVHIFAEAKGHDDEYMLCNNLATLIWLGQMGALEIHTWHSRVIAGRDTSMKSTNFSGSIKNVHESIIEFPDSVLFDIDPYIYSGKEALNKEPELNTPAFERGKQVAFWLKELLDGMHLESVVKTSGKTGLHIFVPIRRTLTYAAVREIARTFAQHLVAEHPNDITTEWATEKRRGKVFLDYNMNVRGKSTIAPYCPRGLPGAAVAMPLTWKELATAHPMDFRIPTVIRRSDAWTQVLNRKQDIEKILSVASNRS